MAGVARALSIGAVHLAIRASTEKKDRQRAAERASFETDHRIGFVQQNTLIAS